MRLSHNSINRYKHISEEHEAPLGHHLHCIAQIHRRPGGAGHRRPGGAGDRRPGGAGGQLCRHRHGLQGPGGSGGLPRHSQKYQDLDG